MAVNVPLLRFSELSETNAISDSDYMIVFDAADQKKIKWSTIKEKNEPILTGHTMRFDNGIQIYFMQLSQLSENDLVGYYKYFNFDLPFRDNLYCVQITNNTNNERVYVDTGYLTADHVLVRCANTSAWVYVMCIGYWK